MTQWLAANWGTILAAGIVAAVVILVIRVMVKDKKSGRSHCGAGCAGCAMKCGCHRKCTADKIKK